MKKRVMSWWVTVTGPPRADLLAEALDDRAGGIEHVAEADDAEAGLRNPRCSASAWMISSATRLLAPITLFGRTALSVEIIVKRVSLASNAARARTRVPNDVVLDADHLVLLEQRHMLVGGGVIDGVDLVRRRSARRTSGSLSIEPIIGTSSGRSLLRQLLDAASQQLLLDRVEREFAMIEQDQLARPRRAAICRQISEPIEPPAPVIRMVWPSTASRISSVSGSTGSRRSRSFDVDRPDVADREAAGDDLLGRGDVFTLRLSSVSREMAASRCERVALGMARKHFARSASGADQLGQAPWANRSAAPATIWPCRARSSSMKATSR